MAPPEGVLERAVQHGRAHVEEGLHGRPVPAHLLRLTWGVSLSRVRSSANADGRWRPCCMDQWERRTHPYPVLGSCDADGLRASQLQHAVQSMDGNLHLDHSTLVRAAAQPVTDHLFEP